MTWPESSRPAQVWYKLGKAQLENGQITEAIESYLKATGLRCAAERFSVLDAPSADAKPCLCPLSARVGSSACARATATATPQAQDASDYMEVIQAAEREESAERESPEGGGHRTTAYLSPTASEWFGGGWRKGGRERRRE